MSTTHLPTNERFWLAVKSTLEAITFGRNSEMQKRRIDCLKKV